MATTLGELAARVNGEVRGNPATEIRGANPLNDVASHEITLVDSATRLDALKGSPAAAVVLPRDIRADRLPAICVDDPHTAFATILKSFRPPAGTPPPGIHPTAWVSPSAELGDGVCIGPGTTIAHKVTIGAGTTIHAGAQIAAHCRIGQGVTIYPTAVLYENTRLGDRAVVHAGAVLGAHGFGFREINGRHAPCAQLGYVEVGEDVEIGAATTIDRGTFGATRIGSGTKIDNLVQIAHNCRIGKHNIICSQVGIAGSTTTGDYVIMAGQVGIRDHVHIGERAVLSAMAGVSHDVAPGAVMMGIPATPEREQKLKQAALAKLAQMRKEFKAVKRELAELSKTVAASQTGPKKAASSERAA